MIESDDSSSYSSLFPQVIKGKNHMPSTSVLEANMGSKKKKSFDINVSRNWDLTRKDSNGRTLMHYFAFNGDIENANKLLSYSFPIDMLDNSLNSSLHVSSEYGQRNFVTFLLANNSLINRQNINGKTSLHLAVERNQREVVDTLLYYGANPNIIDLEGASPLHYSSANGFLEISDSLIKHGAFVNIKDYAKETPIFWAIRESKIEQVQTLIKNGANLSIKNEDGETPFTLAQEFDEDDIALILQKTIQNNFSSISNLPSKSQPVNFSFPKESFEQINEYRPQSL